MATINEIKAIQKRDAVWRGNFEEYGIDWRTTRRNDNASRAARDRAILLEHLVNNVWPPRSV